MADDISSLAAGEEPGGKEKGRTAKPKGKAPKAPPPTQDWGGGPGNKAIGAKKKGSKLFIILIAAFALIFLVAIFILMVYFNVFGVGERVLAPVNEWLFSAIVWANPEFSSVDEELRRKNEERVEELDGRAVELDTREEEVTMREEAANTREIQLNRRHEALNRREAAIGQREDQAIPMFRRALTEEELADVQALSRLYSQMSPETAAEILAGLEDNMDIASILYHMNERNAATIIAAMEVELAVAITEILLSG